PLVRRERPDRDRDAGPARNRFPTPGYVAAAAVLDLDLPLDVRAIVEPPRLCATVQPRTHQVIPFLRAARIAATWSGTDCAAEAAATGSRCSNQWATSPTTACRMSAGSSPAA